MGLEGDLPDSERLLADQRSRWAKGDRVPVEAFLDIHPNLRDHPEVLLDLIYGEVVLRRRVGEKPTADEYLTRFPDLADQIRTQFEVDAVLADGLSRAAPASAPSTRPAKPGGTHPLAPPGYSILEELGRGGMGVVYKARHTALDRLVALKVIRTGELADPGERSRFEAEARAVARLSHPNVVQIYEVGESDERPFLALEYVAGGSLADMLHGPPFSPRPAAALVATLARAVQHAHDAGIVHRDLKPANVLIQRALTGNFNPNPGDATAISLRPNEPTIGMTTADLCPKLTDFGLAKHLGSDGLTRTGDFLGTPNYAAPEQAAGRPDVGPAADVYALGAILYHLVTGRPPFAGSTALETLDQVRFAEPVSPSRLQPSLPKDLGTIILTCLRKEPGRRYATARALAEDLSRFLVGQSIRARAVGRAERAVKWARRSPATAALVLVSGVAAAVLLTVLIVSDVRIRQKQVETQSALKAVTEARNDVTKTLDRERHTLYLQRIRLAQAALLGNNTHEAERELMACLPGADQPDLRGWEWYYFNRLCHTELVNFREHRDPVQSVAFSPDGTRIASVSVRTLKVWDAASGRVLLELPGPDVLAKATAHSRCCFSPDGKRLALGDATRNRLTVYDAANGQELFAVTGIAPAYNTDGKRLAAYDLPAKKVRIYDASTGTDSGSYSSPDYRVSSFAFRPDGLWIAASRPDRSIRVWNVESGKSGPTLRGQATGNFFPVMSSDGRRIASAGTDGTIKLWEFGREEETVVIGAHPTGNINFLAFSADAERLASADFGGSVRVWDARGQPIQTLPGHGAPVYGLAFGPGGRLLASGSIDRTVKIWDTNKDPNAVIFRGHTNFVVGAAFSPDGRQVASSGFDGALKTWDPVTGQLRLDLSGGSDTFCHVRYSPAGDRLIVANTETLVRFRDSATGALVGDFRGRTSSRIVATSPCGTYVAAAANQEVKVWNLTDGRQLCTLRGHTAAVSSVAFGPDSRLIATASHDSLVKVWEVTTGHEVHSLHGHDDRVTSVAFSADGLRLASGGSDALIRLWDVQTGAETMTIRKPWGRHTVHTLALSPDGRRLASGGNQAAVTLWDTETGQEVLQLPTSRMIVTTVLFSDDGRRLAAVTNDGAITVWDAPVAADPPGEKPDH